MASPYQSPTVPADQQSPTPKSCSLTPRALIWAVLAVVILITAPLLFDLVYAPINREWTVVQFGCGCNQRSFNANHFDVLIIGGCLAGCDRVLRSLCARDKKLVVGTSCVRRRDRVLDDDLLSSILHGCVDVSW